MFRILNADLILENPPLKLSFKIIHHITNGILNTEECLQLNKLNIFWGYNGGEYDDFNSVIYVVDFLFDFRTSGGRLHLVPDIGKIPLADALLIEDPSDHGVNDDDGKNLTVPDVIYNFYPMPNFCFVNLYTFLTLSDITTACWKNTHIQQTLSVR